ncbi:MAG: hypothetical protein ACK5PP_09025 [Acidimicrobiales bacterium]
MVARPTGRAPRPRPDRPGRDPLTRLRATLRHRALRRRAAALGVAAAALLTGLGPLGPDRPPSDPVRSPTDAITEPAGSRHPAGPEASSPAGGDPRHLAADERAVAIPSPGPALLDEGDHVDLVAVTVDPTGGVVTTVLQPPGRVIAVDTGVVVVALPADEAVTAVDHLATGAIELLRRP